MEPGDLAWRLSEQRLKDAQALLTAECWSAAYYLAGYSVELAFKAIASARIAHEMTRVVLPERKDLLDLFVHSPGQLARHPFINLDQKSRSAGAPIPQWNLVKTWKEGSRYVEWPREEAEAMVAACATYVEYVRKGR